VTSASRAITTDETEEVILVDSAQFSHLDVDRLTRELMDALPDTKVWVIENSGMWDVEPI